MGNGGREDVGRGYGLGRDGWLRVIVVCVFWEEKSRLMMELKKRLWSITRYNSR